MANTLTNLVPDLYAALNVVSRELVGFIPAVGRNSGAERAAVGENVRVPMAPVGSMFDVNPAMAIPEPADNIFTDTAIQITKSKGVSFGWTGEEQRGVNNGPGYQSLQVQQIAQAMRTLTNAVEADCAATYLAASRAFGTAGASPFATNLGDPAQVRKILSDNGSPLSDLQMVIDTTAGASMRTLAQLTKANEANDASLLRQGVLLDIHGFAIRESGQIAPVAAVGTGAGYVTSGALTVGQTDIPLITGTGTLLAGDVITFNGDTNKYVVAAGISAPGTVKIAAPGIRKAATSGKAVTVTAAFTPNLAFDRNAIQLVTRAPALPSEGDAAVDSMMITDDRSGLSFEVRMYPGYRKMRYEIALAWGVKVIKPEHTAILLG
ncbi:MAG: P22 coat - protein 5 family protein [Plesiomonas sp.]